MARNYQIMTLLLCSFLVMREAFLSEAQNASNQDVPQLEKNLTYSPTLSRTGAGEGPGADQKAGDEKGFWPMVNVDKADNKTKVDVHVPIFFDMTNDNDANEGRSKLDLSVLHGLVTVNRDKSKTNDGRLTGPLTVTVFGIPVYVGAGTVNLKSGERPSLLSRLLEGQGGVRNSSKVN